MMSRHHVWGSVIVLMGVVTVLGWWTLMFSTRSSVTQVDLQAVTAADYVRIVVQANRKIYSTQVVEHLRAKGIAPTARDWKKRRAVPLADQIVSDSGRLAEAEGVRYRLASLKPINAANAPETESEREGLEAVMRSPAQPSYKTISMNGREYFQAIYADVAVSRECAACHNRHANGADIAYRVGDVLGALIITFPATR
jgi:hypothetical protein